MGMAMAGHGLHAQPPPRPPHHNYNAGMQQNPGNQLYVGNVSHCETPFAFAYIRISSFLASLSGWMAGPQGLISFCR
jgi:hypothetical protein